MTSFIQRLINNEYCNNFMCKKIIIMPCETEYNKQKIHDEKQRIRGENKVLEEDIIRHKKDYEYHLIKYNDSRKKYKDVDDKHYRYLEEINENIGTRINDYVQSMYMYALDKSEYADIKKKEKEKYEYHKMKMREIYNNINECKKKISVNNNYNNQLNDELEKYERVTIIS